MDYLQEVESFRYAQKSGIPDYYDEEVMGVGDFEELWRARPIYHIRTLEDFLPLFQTSAMKFEPGVQFSYNNAGYILLGLVVEAASQQKFTDYVQANVFNKAAKSMYGYFEFDTLPGNTAQGYIDAFRNEGTFLTAVGCHFCIYIQ